MLGQEIKIAWWKNDMQHVYITKMTTNKTKTGKKEK